MSPPYRSTIRSTIVTPSPRSRIRRLIVEGVEYLEKMFGSLLIDVDPYLYRESEQRPQNLYWTAQSRGARYTDPERKRIIETAYRRYLFRRFYNDKKNY